MAGYLASLETIRNSAVRHTSDERFRDLLSSISQVQNLHEYEYM